MQVCWPGEGREPVMLLVQWRLTEGNKKPADLPWQQRWPANLGKHPGEQRADTGNHVLMSVRSTGARAQHSAPQTAHYSVCGTYAAFLLVALKADVQKGKFG